MSVSAVPSHRGMADQVMEAIRGQTMASKLLLDLRDGLAHQDALLDAIRAAGGGDRLRGFARALQKQIERL